MKVELLIFWRQKKCQQTVGSPSRFSIYRQAAKLSGLAAYTIQAYVWTKDNFWSCLRQISITPCNAGDFVYYAFRAVVDVAQSNDDVDVLLLLGREITRVMHIPAHTHVACRVSLLKESLVGCKYRVPNLLSSTSMFTDILLLQLADQIEENRDFLEDLLQENGVTEWDYHYALQGRLWFVNGDVRIVASELANSVCYFPAKATVEAEIEKFFECIVAALSVQEKYLSEEIQKWLDSTVSPQMRWCAVTCFALLPPVLASVVKQLPRSLLYECLRHHLVRFPLRYKLESNILLLEKEELPCVIVTSPVPQTLLGEHLYYSNPSMKEEDLTMEKENQTLKDVQSEMNIIHAHNRAARTPLERLPSYLYELLLGETPLPSSSFFSENVKLCFAGASEEHAKEVKLGLQISFAMERWRRYLHKSPQEEPFSDTGALDKNAVISILSNLQNQAKTLLETSIDPSFPKEVSAKYRQIIMAPYPVKYIPPLQKKGIRISSQEDMCRKKRTTLDYAKVFEKAMWETSAKDGEGRGKDKSKEEREEEASISSSSSNRSTSWSTTSSETVSVEDHLEEVEKLFFDDLHFTTPTATTEKSLKESKKVDKNALKEVIENPLFSNSIQFLADCKEL